MATIATLASLARAKARKPTRLMERRVPAATRIRSARAKAIVAMLLLSLPNLPNPMMKKTKRTVLQKRKVRPKSLLMTLIQALTMAADLALYLMAPAVPSI
jgi:hypothetical protein